MAFAFGLSFSRVLYLRSVPDVFPPSLAGDFWRKAS